MPFTLNKVCIFLTLCLMKPDVFNSNFIVPAKTCTYHSAISVITVLLIRSYLTPSTQLPSCLLLNHDALGPQIDLLSTQMVYGHYLYRYRICLLRRCIDKTGKCLDKNTHLKQLLFLCHAAILSIFYLN